MSPNNYDLETPAGASVCVLLTHGAGSNRNSTLLRRLAKAFNDAAFATLRYDLPYRIERPTGPPRRGSAAADREGIARAVHVARNAGFSTVILGGHSYGGRQSSMLAAERPELANGLVLFGYPLRPPRSETAPDRTAHFPSLMLPVLFVHGTRDPFGSVDDIREAAKLITGRTNVLPVERAGHELANLDASRFIGEFRTFFLPTAA